MPAEELRSAVFSDEKKTKGPLRLKLKIGTAKCRPSKAKESRGVGEKNERRRYPWRRNGGGGGKSKKFHAVTDIIKPGERS